MRGKRKRVPDKVESDDNEPGNEPSKKIIKAAVKSKASSDNEPSNEPSKRTTKAAVKLKASTDNEPSNEPSKKTAKAAVKSKASSDHEPSNEPSKRTTKAAVKSKASTDNEPSNEPSKKTAKAAVKSKASSDHEPSNEPSKKTTKAAVKSKANTDNEPSNEPSKRTTKAAVKAKASTDNEPSKKTAKAAVKSKASTDKSQKLNYSFWLMKSEPETRMENGVDVKFGIDDLKKEPEETACWDGVRNYQARNFMRDMKVGQQAFFYHSNTKEPGIAGIIEIVKESYPDHTQFDKKDPHFDGTSKKEDPRWSMVDVQYKRMLKRYISLRELKGLHMEQKSEGGPLANVALFTRARLSVQPLTEDEWDYILSLENREKD